MHSRELPVSGSLRSPAGLRPLMLKTWQLHNFRATAAPILRYSIYRLGNLTGRRPGDSSSAGGQHGGEGGGSDCWRRAVPLHPLRTAILCRAHLRGVRPRLERQVFRRPLYHRQHQPLGLLPAFAHAAASGFGARPARRGGRHFPSRGDLPTALSARLAAARRRRLADWSISPPPSRPQPSGISVPHSVELTPPVGHPPELIV